jgi:hypothetical protein
MTNDHRAWVDRETGESYGDELPESGAPESYDHERGIDTGSANGSGSVGHHVELAERYAHHDRQSVSGIHVSSGARDADHDDGDHHDHDSRDRPRDFIKRCPYCTSYRLIELDGDRTHHVYRCRDCKHLHGRERAVIKPMLTIPTPAFVPEVRPLRKRSQDKIKPEYQNVQEHTCASSKNKKHSWVHRRCLHCQWAQCRGSNECTTCRFGVINSSVEHCSYHVTEKESWSLINRPMPPQTRIRTRDVKWPERRALRARTMAAKAPPRDPDAWDDVQIATED